MTKKGLPEIIVRALMSLYCGAKTKVSVGSELSEEFLVQTGVHQGSFGVTRFFWLFAVAQSSADIPNHTGLNQDGQIPNR